MNSDREMNISLKKIYKERVDCMPDIHFKECRPEVTTQKLKNILKEMEIDTEEVFSSKSKIDTYSLRVIFQGTEFGSNGKGVSKEYCEASAYAELFERFQNDLMPQVVVDFQKNEYPFFKAFDEQILSAADIVSENNSFIQYYFEQRHKEKATFVEKIDAFNEVQRTDYWLYGLDGSYVTIPFFSLKRKKIAYLPHSTYSLYYGSNGMCAGNTPQEALVQGLSEIFERVAQKRILTEKPTLPDIPQSYLERFPLIANLFQKLKEKSKGYSYYLKDCSFGGEYPVAALIAVEENTGRFGVKLGCHPDYGVAMERCFTEATQGRDIDDYAKISYLDFDNFCVDSDFNICNSYKTGQAQFPYQIFNAKPTYSFYSFDKIEGRSNDEILKEWINKILSKGYDILIRDVSYLGFPSYHIIIPGVSELQDANDTRFRAFHTKLFVQRIFAEENGVSENNVPYILATLKYFDNISMESGVQQLFLNNCFHFPCIEAGLDSQYMQAMCYAYMEKYENAECIMTELLREYKKRLPQADVSFFVGIRYFLSAMRKFNNFSETMAYISVFFNKKICNKINNIFMIKSNIFICQYPCGEKKSNDYDKIIEIRKKLFNKQIISGISQEALSKLLRYSLPEAVEYK